MALMALDQALLEEKVVPPAALPRTPTMILLTPGSRRTAATDGLGDGATIIGLSEDASVAADGESALASERVAWTIFAVAILFFTTSLYLDKNVIFSINHRSCDEHEYS